MKAALLDRREGLRTFVIVFEAGDEAMDRLTSFAKDQGLNGSHFTGIGAFSRVVVGYFDWSSKEYREVPLDEQVEVLSFAGDISIVLPWVSQLRDSVLALRAQFSRARRVGETAGS